jgi:hypothetical protein
MRFRRDEEGISLSGGRFVEPAANNILPPVRNYQIQGGRFVPTADSLLPPIRTAQLQVDWENAYHFGRRS